MSRVFQFRVTGRACENFGAVDYTVTERLIEHDGGIEVQSRACGVCEGERVDSRSMRFAAGIRMDTASAYRLTHGYVEVCP